MNHDLVKAELTSKWLTLRARSTQGVEIHSQKQKKRAWTGLTRIALCAIRHLGIVGEPGGSGRGECVRGWPIQDILSRLGFCAQTNPPFIAPSTCIARTVAIPLQYYCAIVNPLPTPRVDAVHHKCCASQYRVKAK